MARKTVYFYVIYLKDKGGKECDYRLIKERINNVFGNNCINNGKNDALILEEGDNQVTLDVLSNGGDYLFGRMGRIKENNTMQFRHYSTLSTEEVLDQRTARMKGIEVFTYFLLDYNTGILSMVLGQSAPRARYINNILNKYDNEFIADIEAIGDPSIIKQIFNNDILAEIAYTIAVPNSQVLGEDVIGLSRKQIAAIKKSNTKQLQVVLKPESRGFMAQGTELVKSIVKPFVDEREKYKSVRIKAKELDGYMQDYDLLDSYCTYKININLNKDSGRQEMENEFFEKLLAAYIEQRKILTAFSDRIK